MHKHKSSRLKNVVSTFWTTGKQNGWVGALFFACLLKSTTQTPHRTQTIKGDKTPQTKFIALIQQFPKVTACISTPSEPAMPVSIALKATLQNMPTEGSSPKRSNVVANCKALANDYGDMRKEENAQTYPAS